MYSLYFVARAYEKDAKLVLQCIESGKLWSGMERDDAKELLNFVETGDEIAVEDLPQSQQVRVKRERILPQMEDVIRRRLFASCTDMDDKTIAIILSALMNHAPFFDDGGGARVDSAASSKCLAEGAERQGPSISDTDQPQSSVGAWRIASNIRRRL
jgi:hypothetical protein